MKKKAKSTLAAIVCCVAAAGMGAYGAVAQHGSQTAASEPVTVDLERLTKRPRDGARLLEGRPFTGVAITYEGRGGERWIREKNEYLDGHRHGLRERWYANGQLGLRSHYRRGVLQGMSESYWESGRRKAQTRYVAGKGHGISTSWYRSGAKRQQRNLVHGREQGMQRAWRQNGKLYANYEVVGGREYGLRKPDLCLEVAAP